MSGNGRGSADRRGADSRGTGSRGTGSRGTGSRGSGSSSGRPTSAGVRGGERRSGSGPRREDRRDDRRDDRRGDRRAGDSSGRPAKREFSRPRKGSDERERRDDKRTEDEQRYDGPEIPEHITGNELDRTVASALKSLPEKLALRVARHLVAAGELLESDPKTAYEHTLAARSRAGRLAVVREAVGEAAYAAGDFEEALAQLRAAKRMNGSLHYVPMMVDCHRALGRPDKALTLARDTTRQKLTPQLAAELVIVEAGARRDRGEIEAALRTLENAPLMSKSREGWVARLRYMYADTLASAGRQENAVVWFHRTVAVDWDDATDAGERAAEIERSLS